MKMFLHPSFAKLSAYVDGDVTGHRASAISAHVMRCPRCQATVDFVRQLHEKSSRLRMPVVPPDLDQRIANTAHTSPVRGAIVPEPVPPVPERGDDILPSKALAVSGGILALIVAVVALRVPNAVSDATVLEFDNEHPRAGDVIEVTYRSNGRFSFGDQVVLRAEIFRKGRAPWDARAEYLILDTLNRIGTGHYKGAFEWSSDMAFADFAVESPDAQRVDSRPWGGWVRLEHDGGQPSFEALRQRFHSAFRGRDLVTSLEVATLATERFPDEPGSWDMTQLTLGIQYGSGDFPESRRTALDRAFRRLVAKRDSAHWVTPERIGHLYQWAYYRDDPLLPAIRLEMLRSAPLTRPAVQDRALSIFADADREIALDRFEVLWQMAGPSYRSIPDLAFRVSLELEESGAALLWGRRLIELSNADTEWVLTDLLARGSVRDSAILELQASIERLHDGSTTRKLYQTGNQFAATQAAKQRRLADLLGRALLADGRVSEGLSYLEVGLEAEWDVRAFRAAADGYLARGDTMRAAAFLARIAAEERLVSGVSDVDSFGKALSGTSWKRLLAGAESTMTLHLAGEIHWEDPFSDTLTVRDEDGQARSLRSALLGTRNVLAFAWFDQDGWPAIESLAAVAPRRLNEGIRTFIVTDELPTEDFRKRAANYPGLTWLHDVDGDARRYFGSWYVPDYFVVSADGSAQFRYTSEEAIPRQLAYLRSLRASESITAPQPQ